MGLVPGRKECGWVSCSAESVKNYVLHLLENVLLTLHLCPQLLWPQYKLFLKFLLEIILFLFANDKSSVHLGDNIGLLLGELYFLRGCFITMVLP